MERPVTDTLRAELQLSLGGAAVLGDELPTTSPMRVFRAVGRDSGAAGTDGALWVLLHPAPPDGPDLSAFRLRLAQLTALAHPTLVPPIAAGEFRGSVWVVERACPRAARDRIAPGQLLPVRDGINVLRDVTRALAALHRRGMAHGAIDAEAVWLTEPDVLLGSLGRSLRGTVRGDLDALAATTWALLTRDAPIGPGARLSSERRGVPPALDDLLAVMLDGLPERRPARAEAILDALDALPAVRPAPWPRLFDGTGIGARQRRTKTMLGVLVLLGVAIAVLLLARRL